MQRREEDPESAERKSPDLRTSNEEPETIESVHGSNLQTSTDEPPTSASAPQRPVQVGASAPEGLLNGTSTNRKGPEENFTPDFTRQVPTVQTPNLDVEVTGRVNAEDEHHHAITNNRTSCSMENEEKAPERMTDETGQAIILEETDSRGTRGGTTLAGTSALESVAERNVIKNVGKSQDLETNGPHTINLFNKQNNDAPAHFQRGPGTKSGQSGDPHVLDPDSPLMIRFQKALKELLEKQLAKLDEEVVELNNSLKKKVKHREDLGVTLFTCQEHVSHSQKQIDVIKKSLLSLEETRNNLDNDLKQVRVLHNETQNQISSIRDREEKLRVECEVLKSVQWQLKQWEEDYNSELTISQQIADKTEKQKEEMAKQKQKQDLLLLKLRRAVLGLESRQAQLRAQREVKLQQQDTLRKAIAEGSADLEALQTEQVRLTRVWNGVVISLQQRDRVYSSVQKDLMIAKESFQLMLAEIDSYKRVAKVEMQNNEKLMSLLHRLEKEYNDLVRSHDKNTQRISELEGEYAQVAGMIKQTEGDLDSALTDGKIHSQQSDYQHREINYLTQQKILIETKILEKLQDQSKHDKAFQHLASTIRSLKASNKRQEMTFISLENQIAKSMVEVEKARGVVMNNESLLVEANKEADIYALQIDQLEGSIKRNKLVADNKTQVINQLSKKLESILGRSGNSEESPQEIRIKAIESEIEEASQAAEKKQAFWLRLQSHIVHLTEERQKQLQQLNVLYKQIHILKQRSIKIDHEIGKHRKDEKDIEQQMRGLEVSLKRMTTGLHNKRGYKETLDKENVLMQAEALGLLKVMERESIELDEELLGIEESNIMLNQEISDLKRDCLAWEKKIKLASETKLMNDEGNKAHGELNQIRVEIHRMEVRFSQLCKVQETLVRDLEHCIMRRESLLDQADANEKRSSASNTISVSNRIVFERKLENLSNKTKQANHESRKIQTQIERELPEELAQLSKSLQETQQALSQVEQAVAGTRKRVQEAQLLKQQKLETLVRLQKRVKMYTKVKEGKHKVLFRADSAQEAEMHKQRVINNDLTSIVGIMQQHFPSLNLLLLRTQNTLQTTGI